MNHHKEMNNLQMNQQANLWDRPRIKDEQRREALKNEVLRLTLPSEDNPYGHKRKEIARLVNRSENTVWVIQSALAKDGKLTKNASGRIVKEKPPQELILKSEISRQGFQNVASIKRWVNAMRKKGIHNVEEQVRYLWKVCKTLEVHPDAFLQPIQEAETLHDRFIEKFQRNDIFYLRKSKHQKQKGLMNPDHYTRSIRSFIKRNGLEIPDGYLETKTKSKSIYATIHLTDKQRKEAINFLRNIDGNLADNFIIHHEFGMRADTLKQAKLSYIKKNTSVEGINCEYYLVSLYEKKQDETYSKLAITPEAREVMSRFETLVPINKDEYNEKLRELYSYLGLINSDPLEQEEYENGTKEWYLVNNATHAIRKSCVHWLMRISGERAEVITTMFWETPDTLKHYKKATVDSILQQGICYFCNKPDIIDENYERFCTLRHALAYYNGGKK